ncbi:MAG: rRNA pseudouridine synthase [Nanoarchaeota archaeon]|nr:rRNA pseudouridine synthase [Nanoarchaeota archaeon]MBU1005655.1 rRNA pseudouridine synthase [Nanoarchaeota archaeon]MBU1946920.1 rRNA pseudouridine synthase [Nanoarchaeota archaeon]
MLERVQKIMAHSGLASRRKCEEMIAEGAVQVNGRTIKLGDKADSGKDRIEVNGKPIKKEKQVYIILNKPKEVISSVGDYNGRKTVIDLVKTKERVFHVGRLDMDVEGIMILTNDGDFANRVIHPSNNVSKTYTAVLSKPFTEYSEKRLRQGIMIGGRKVNVFDIRSIDNEATISIHEGRKHIVKNIFIALGYRIISLRRIAIGNLRTKLNPGEYKIVSRQWLESKIF